MLSERLLMMPKIDLHCHLDGSLPLSVVREMLGRDVALEELQVKDDCRSLAQYLEKFDIPVACIQTSEHLKTAAREFLLSLQKDRIIYGEVRFAPQLSTGEGLGCRRVMESVLEGLEEAKQLCGIDYGVIACMMRHHDEETNFQMLKECREFLGEGLCAVDLAGDEAGFPTERFFRLFQEAKKMDYPFTIHAGECGDVNSILQAVEWGAGRIGHGIAMAGHPEVQKVCVKKRVGVEMCPISNYQTKALEPEAVYPIREFAKNGVLVTVNTDNRTVSNTSIAKEMAFLQERFRITEEELKMYQIHSIETAFCEDSLKHRLLTRMTDTDII